MRPNHRQDAASNCRANRKLPVLPQGQVNKCVANRNFHLPTSARNRADLTQVDVALDDEGGGRGRGGTDVATVEQT